MFFDKSALKTTADIDQAARELSAAWGKHFSPAPNFEGRKKNKLRDMICGLAGIHGGYQGFTENEQPEVATMRVSRSYSPYRVEVGEQEIQEDVFDNEMVDWKLVERDQMVDDLFDWIGEARRDSADRNLMIADVRMLMEWDDLYVWSSILTNDYVSPSHEPVRFNEICQQVLDANAQLSC